MPQVVEVPGYGDVEFPDGMSNEQIAEAIRSNMKPAPAAKSGPSVEQQMAAGVAMADTIPYPQPEAPAQPKPNQYDGMSFWDRVKNDASNIPKLLTPVARGGIKAVTSLPGLAADVGVQSRNLATGSNYALPTQEFERSLDEYFPMPGVPGERALEFGTSLLGGARLPVPSVKNPAPASFVRPDMDAIRQSTLRASQEAGYVVPPATTNPTMVNRFLESIAGKTAIAQQAAMNNQNVTNTLAKRAVGLSEDVPLSKGALSAARAQAGDAYAALRGAGEVTLDEGAAKTLDGLASKFSGNKLKELLGGGNDIPKVVEAIKAEKLSGDTIVDVLSLLRDKASEAYGKGSKEAGSAYKKIASTLENVMERNLSGDALKAFKEARQLIAKTYTVEGALNESTGQVVASKLAAQLAKGKPLSGDLRTAAQFGQAFPRAAQAVTDSGPVNHLDSVFSGGAAAMTRQPWWLLYPFLRKGVSAGLLSQGGQKLATPGSVQVPRGLLSGGLVAEEDLRRQ